MDFPRDDQQPHCVNHDTAATKLDRSMKCFTPLMLAVVLSPRRAAMHDKWALVAHGERKKAAYLVLMTITQEIELIQVESLNQCEIGSEIMNWKIEQFLKGYKCIPDLL